MLGVVRTLVAGGTVNNPTLGVQFIPSTGSISGTVVNSTAGGTTTATTSITYAANGTTGMTFTEVNLDDGSVDIVLPFSMVIDNEPTDTVRVNGNSQMFFHNNRVIVQVDNADRTLERWGYRVTGTAPSRVYILRYEGSQDQAAVQPVGSPNFVWEARFYEATPAQIDIHLITVTGTGNYGYYTSVSQTVAYQDALMQTFVNTVSARGNRLDGTKSVTNVDLLGWSVMSAATRTAGTATEGYYTLTPPWQVRLGNTLFSTLHVHTNSFIQFGGTPATDIFSYADDYALLIGSVDNLTNYFNVQRVGTRVSGSTPNRRYTIRYEGSYGVAGITGYPNHFWEVNFYETSLNITLVTGKVYRGNTFLSQGSNNTVMQYLNSDLYGYDYISQEMDSTKLPDYVAAAYVGRGWEGQNLASYLTTTAGYNSYSTGFTIDITIPADYTLAGYRTGSLPALNLSGFSPNDVINIYNYGQIIGHGGAGGARGTASSTTSVSGSAGGAGGDAIVVYGTTATINLYNYGTIKGGAGGGGGGGAGSYSGFKGSTQYSSGGLGGNGNGINVTPNTVNASYTTGSTTGTAGGTNAGTGGNGGTTFESAGQAGTNGNRSSGGAGGAAGYAIRGVSKINIVVNTGTIGNTTG